MLRLTDEAAPVQSAPEPDEREADYLRSMLAPPVAAPDAHGRTLPASGWCLCQAAYQDALRRLHDPLGAHLLCSLRLRRLSAWLLGQSAAGVLASDPGDVPVPRLWDYSSPLARAVVDEAALLYPYDSAVVRIAARRLIDVADGCERLGSANARDYLIDSEAEVAAMTDLICDSIAS